MTDPARSLPVRTEKCPDCGHEWGAHRRRDAGERCYYVKFTHPCPCRTKNPIIEAEDRLAGALWRMTTGGGQT